MTNPPQIRRASIGDVDQIASLFDQYRRFYSQPSDLAAAKDFLTERLKNAESIVFVATDNGQALGFTQLYPSYSSVSMKRLWILNDLYVSEEARGRGVGRALIEAARAFSAESGARGLTLKTAVDNTAAQRLYEDCGWRRDERFISYNLTTDAKT